MAQSGPSRRDVDPQFPADVSSHALQADGQLTMEGAMTTPDTIAQSETKPHALIASDRVEGTTVCRVSGEKIGTIQRLMIDKTSGNDTNPESAGFFSKVKEFWDELKE